MTEPNKWYVLRVSYNQGQKAYKGLTAANIEAYMPMHHVVKVVRGRRRKLWVPYVPGLVFANSTQEVLEEFMHGSHESAKYVHFYRNRLEEKIENFMNPPLVVSNEAMTSFRTICDAPKDDIRFADTKDVNFKPNTWVEVIDGDFKGVKGRVTHWKNQTRVGVVIDGLFTVFTTYIPKPFLLLLPTPPQR